FLENKFLLMPPSSAAGTPPGAYFCKIYFDRLLNCFPNFRQLIKDGRAGFPVVHEPFLVKPPYKFRNKPRRI
ncbi:MAG: hypothetical protein DPW18_20215, partial [Chloroflexi bacterium]|nr:hypothetical protein [Chloroflexota bacterium]